MSTSVVLSSRIQVVVMVKMVCEWMWLTERRRDGETEGRRDGGTERRRDGETEGRRDKT